MILTLFVSCKQSNTSDSKDSFLETKDDKTFIYNKYYKALDDEKVVLIHENGIVGSDEPMRYTIAPVLPEGFLFDPIQFDANTIEYEKNLLIAEVFKEGKDYTYSLYSLINGNHLMDYTYDKFDVFFNNEDERRFIGFYSRNATTKNSFENNVVGIFYYADLNEQLSKLQLKVVNDYDLSNLDISNPVIELMGIENNAIQVHSGKSLYYSGSDGKKKEEVYFDIKVTFYTNQSYLPLSFMLQVRNDQLIVPNDFQHSIFYLSTF